MKHLPLILILVCSVALAQTIRYDNQDIEMNDKYSGKGYPYHDLSFKHETDMKNINIYGSCFYQEWVEDDTEVVKDIFPDDMTGVTFYNCNLDNVYVSPENTVVGGSYRKIKIQNDWDDWILNENLTPKEPINKEQRLKAGKSIKPKDIPKKKWTKEERDAFEDTLNSISITP